MTNTNTILIDKVLKAFRDCLPDKTKENGEILDKLIEEVTSRMISPEQVELLKENNIELILKEMWVWNDYLKKEKAFVLFKNNSEKSFFKYFTKQYEIFFWYQNASEINPNEKKEEDLIGKVGYFWDDGDSIAAYGKLCYIIDDDFPYLDSDNVSFKHFSLTPPKLDF